MEWSTSIGVIMDTRERDLWNAFQVSLGMTTMPSSEPSVSVSLLRERPSLPTAPSLNMKEGVVEKSSLPIGDIWIVARKIYAGGAREDAVLAILERKTVADLWSSIKDGRYHDQDLRVRDFCQHAMEEGSGKGTTTPEYIKIIEGLSPTPSSAGFLKTMPHNVFFRICDASRMTLEKKEFVTSIVRTFSIQETMLYLDMLYDLFEKKLHPTEDTLSHIKEKKLPTSPEALWKSLSFSKDITKNVNAAKRGDGISPSLLLAGALSTVPRLSFSTAESIAAAFGGYLSTFIEEGTRDNVAWRNKILLAMKRPSPKLVDDIRRLFFL